MTERYKTDQRAALFGGRGGKGVSARNTTSSVASEAQAREILEQQNDAALDDLEGKVSRLKEITNTIGKEVKDTNNMIDGMMSAFDLAGARLKGTVLHLQQMTQQKGARMGLLVVGFIVLFLAMYILSSYRPRLFSGAAPGVVEDGTLELRQNATDGGR
mmetsp:Transcript_28085/g.71061  ORF Transcript_28085/g.71061 Transcript_28085/m.71061 type:complete len:159 (-) Transcript_28085:134-610(-)